MLKFDKKKYFILLKLFDDFWLVLSQSTDLIRVINKLDHAGIIDRLFLALTYDFRLHFYRETPD